MLRQNGTTGGSFCIVLGPMVHHSGLSNTLHIAHSKCTVTAVHNLSIQVLATHHKKSIGKFLGGHIV